MITDLNVHIFLEYPSFRHEITDQSFTSRTDKFNCQDEGGTIDSKTKLAMHIIFLILLLREKVVQKLWSGSTRSPRRTKVTVVSNRVIWQVQIPHS